MEGCGTVLAHPRYLQHHIKYQHLLKKKYVCPHPSCGRLFRLQKQLLRHAKHHTDQRDYICEYCARAFKSSHNLAVHRMIHTGEKPLQFTCRQKASLNWHMKKHDADASYRFSCSLCGKRFEKKDSVVAHKAKSHPEVLIAEALAANAGALITGVGDLNLEASLDPSPSVNPPPTASLDPSALSNLENDDDGLSNCGNTTFNNLFRIREAGSVSLSQWSFSTLSSGTQLSYRECFSWTRHPLILKNRRVVVASFLLLITGLALIFTGVAIQVNPSAGVSSAIFFVPGFLLLIPGVYHVIFIYCAVRGRRGFRFFYLPYFEK
ncbi:ZFP91 ligase, partial [Amia calva]|nr:ZFP91 ligase [Amia calva]